MSAWLSDSGDQSLAMTHICRNETESGWFIFVSPRPVGKRILPVANASSSSNNAGVRTGGPNQARGDKSGCAARPILEAGWRHEMIVRDDFFGRCIQHWSFWNTLFVHGNREMIMADERELHITLYRRGKSTEGIDGYLKVDVYKLSDFGGILPQKGDVIVPWQDRDQTEHTLFVVEDRHFRPPGSSAHSIDVGLVVTERPGLKEEAHLIEGGG